MIYRVGRSRKMAGMPAAKKPRPRNDRDQGRKPLSEDSPTVIAPIRMTVAQREKLALLGGAAWVREKIDRARKLADK